MFLMALVVRVSLQNKILEFRLLLCTKVKPCTKVNPLSPALTNNCIILSRRGTLELRVHWFKTVPKGHCFGSVFFLGVPMIPRV